jgi:glycosyltransferase involved in cell wall biosynthesis
MNVALIYDSFLENGGGEKSALITAQKLGADIFTTFFDESKIEIPEGVYVHECGLQFQNHKILTFTESAFRLRKWLEQNKDFMKRNFDVFLTSSIYGVSGSFLHPNCHLCLTTPRSLYSDYDIIKHRLNFPSRQIFQIWVKLYKKYDIKWVEDVDRFLAISDVIKHRIKQYYNRESYITYLPVETKKYKWKESEGYWFCPNRLNEEKRVELVVKVFQKLNERLIIAGDGTNRNKILEMIKNYDNISYVGNLNYGGMIKWYSNCKGTICLAREEDLGLIPIESMASGKPCIVPQDGGGLKESILQDKTGWIVRPDRISLMNQVKNITDEEARKMRVACVNRAKYFDVKEYIKRIKNNLSQVLSESSYSSNPTS